MEKNRTTGSKDLLKPRHSRYVGKYMVENAVEALWKWCDLRCQTGMALDSVYMIRTFSFLLCSLGLIFRKPQARNKYLDTTNLIPRGQLKLDNRGYTPIGWPNIRWRRDTRFYREPVVHAVGKKLVSKPKVWYWHFFFSAASASSSRDTSQLPTLRKYPSQCWKN